MHRKIGLGESVPRIFDDKYLDRVVCENFSFFEERIDMQESLLYLIPSAREIARQNYLHMKSANIIANWCYDDTAIEPSGEVVGLFFCEDMEHVFYKMFLDRFKKFVSSEDIAIDEIKNILITSVKELNGASAKRLAMQKWGV